MLQAQIINIDANLPAEIIINAKGLLGLAQEVRTVITTRKGSVPLDRDFGVNFTVIDKPDNVVLPTYVGDIARQIEKYVPRVEVVSINFAPAQGDEIDGFLRPVVKVRVRKEYWHDFA